MPAVDPHNREIRKNRRRRRKPLTGRSYSGFHLILDFFVDRITVFGII